MPPKLRISKARRHLDDCDLEDLFYGPGTTLINGTGYLGPHGDGFWRDASPEVQQAVLTAMREDWERHRETICAAWDSRSADELNSAVQWHGNPARPWAEHEFGAA
jgi:hypothetical protein